MLGVDGLDGVFTANPLHPASISVGDTTQDFADLNTLAFQTEDMAEGMNAFIEKRKAVFKDG